MDKVPFYFPRSCEFCEQSSDGSDDYGGPDPCLALLPDVQAACCGHGILKWDPEDNIWVDRTYVLYSDGTAVYGLEARRQMRKLGGNPPFPPTELLA